MFGRLSRAAATLVLLASAAILSELASASAPGCDMFVEYICVDGCGMSWGEMQWVCHSACGLGYQPTGVCIDSDPFYCQGEPSLICVPV